MPTNKPRLNLTLEPHQYALISELSRLRGIPRTQVVLELFTAAEEVLQRVVTVLQAAERATGSFLTEFEQGIREAENKVQPLLEEAFSVLGGLNEDLKKWDQ